MPARVPFDNEPSGWVLDYVIFLVCFVGAVLAIIFGESATRLTERMKLVYLIFLVLTGVSFMIGGAAHMMMWCYGDEAAGQTWGSENSSWMYLWTLAAAVMPAAAFANLAFSAAAAGCSDRVSWLVLSAATIPVAAEVVVMLTGQLRISGAVSAVTWVLSTFAMSIWFAYQAARDGGWHIWAVSGGNCLMLIGWLVSVTAPAGCHSGPDRRCPYSKEFGTNAIMHTVISLGLIIQILGVIMWTKAMEREQPVEPTEWAAVELIASKV